MVESQFENVLSSTEKAFLVKHLVKTPKLPRSPLWLSWTISSTWELVANSESWAPPRPVESKSEFSEHPQEIHTHIMCEKHCSRTLTEKKGFLITIDSYSRQCDKWGFSGIEPKRKILWKKKLQNPEGFTLLYWQRFFRVTGKALLTFEL